MPSNAVITTIDLIECDRATWPATQMFSVVFMVRRVRHLLAPMRLRVVSVVVRHSP